MAAPASQGDAQSQAMLGMMTPMLVLLGLMMIISLNPGLRGAMADVAATVIEPTIPFHSEYFVPTVFIIGSSIMVVNTIIRGFFMDPMTQVHIGHRNKQISKQLREAQVERDTARADKMRQLQMEIMPDQMAMQSSMMKPMMFTIVFIIGIFSWMEASAAGFRVSYVSLPWQPMWSMMDRVCWIFPAWVITYIAMSAPLGRIIDRHIKIIRFSRHPLVLEGLPIPEPLLHLLKDEDKKSSIKTRKGQRRSRDGPRKKGNIESKKGGNFHAAPPKAGTACPDCSSTLVDRTSSGRLRCSICRNEWR
jgi:uncharacterized membrane protein (DUF106 family)/ribosomal protein L37AE/L43A|tara:strand:- start:4082 stop:4996 length:915 start_codon:yes stop_codon:yes gene_type:complete